MAAAPATAAAPAQAGAAGARPERGSTASPFAGSLRLALAQSPDASSAAAAPEPPPAPADTAPAVPHGAALVTAPTADLPLPGVAAPPGVAGPDTAAKAKATAPARRPPVGPDAAAAKAAAPMPGSTPAGGEPAAPPPGQPPAAGQIISPPVQVFPLADRGVPVRAAPARGGPGGSPAADVGPAAPPPAAGAALAPAAPPALPSAVPLAALTATIQPASADAALPPPGLGATLGIGVPSAGHAGPAPAGAPAASSAAGDRPPPALQLAPALIAIGASGAGTHRLTVRLDPAELGQVEIRIDRPKSGPPEVRIAVERTETLALLQGDHGLLRQALDQAGIPPEGRQIEFRLLPRTDPASAAAAWTAGDPGGGGQTGFGAADRQAGRGPDGRPAGRPDGAPAGDEPMRTGVASLAARWQRAGVNITA